MNNQTYKSFEIYAVTVNISMSEYNKRWKHCYTMPLTLKIKVSELCCIEQDVQ